MWFLSPFYIFVSLPFCHHKSKVRMCLTLYATIALTKFRSAIENELGKETARCFTIVSIIQFHLMFYASRPLANTFAFVPGQSLSPLQSPTPMPHFWFFVLETCVVCLCVCVCHRLTVCVCVFCCVTFVLTYWLMSHTTVESERQKNFDKLTICNPPTSPKLLQLLSTTTHKETLSVQLSYFRPGLAFAAFVFRGEIVVGSILLMFGNLRLVQVLRVAVVGIAAALVSVGAVAAMCLLCFHLLLASGTGL
jgi:hypothetical protein